MPGREGGILGARRRIWLDRGHGPSLATPAAEDADAVAEAELLEAVRRIVRDGADGLTAEHRRVLSLLGAGSTDRDLARELGVAASTANARKGAALSALRAHLEGRFFAERTGRDGQQPSGPPC